MTTLRSSLIAHKASDARVKKITDLTETIVSALDRKIDCSSMIRDIQALTNLVDLNEDNFGTLHTHSSMEEFANKLIAELFPSMLNFKTLD